MALSTDREGRVDILFNPDLNGLDEATQTTDAWLVRLPPKPWSEGLSLLVADRVLAELPHLGLSDGLPEGSAFSVGLQHVDLEGDGGDELVLRRGRDVSAQVVPRPLQRVAVQSVL